MIKVGIAKLGKRKIVTIEKTAIFAKHNEGENQKTRDDSKLSGQKCLNKLISKWMVETLKSSQK